MRYFISKGLVADSATEIAKFIHGTTSLARAQVDKVKKLPSCCPQFETCKKSELKK